MDWQIRAPIGSFASIDDAATGEARIDWAEEEGPDHEACTAAFAAVEARELLGRVVGVSARAAVFDGSVPEAHGIVILTRSALDGAGSDLKGAFGDIRPPEEEQSYCIRTAARGSGRCYLVLGRDRAGALYGTYDLLCRLGFRFLGPDPWDTCVPESIDPPAVDVLESPSFLTRGFHAGDDRGGEAFLLWMARSRLNFWSAKESNKPFCRKLCLKFECGGHAIFERYLPPATYFKEHPEWYGLSEGGRQGKIDGGFGHNICLSNAEARATLAANMVEDLISGDNQWADFIRVWPLDNGIWCECDACKALGSPTDQTLLLAHDCRQAILQARREGRLKREVKVNIPAYHETLPIPTRPLPDGFDHAGTLATFFTIERCYVHALDDPACTEINAGLSALLKDWTTNPDCLFKGDMFIGEYYNVSSFAALAIPFMRSMAADIPFYHRLGARHLDYMHVTTARWGTLSQTNTQFAALLWDHEVDCQSLFHDYLDRRYGTLAESMRAFYETLEQAMRNAKPLKHYAGLEKPRHCLFPILRQKGSPDAPLDIFTSRHFGYAPSYRVTDDGPSLLETLRLLDEAERIIDDALLEARDADVVRRLSDDVRRFRYTRHTVRFIYRLIRVRMFENLGDADRAALEARALRDVGEALRREDLMPRYQWDDSRFHFYDNGLTATWFAAAYAGVMADYGLDTPDTPGGKLRKKDEDTHLA